MSKTKIPDNFIDWMALIAFAGGVFTGNWIPAIALMILLAIRIMFEE